jgi:hypothetical protein
VALDEIRQPIHEGEEMHDIPRKDREDADDVDEDEVSEVSGGLSILDDGGCIPLDPGKDYPDDPGPMTNPGYRIDPYLE